MGWQPLCNGLTECWVIWWHGEQHSRIAGCPKWRQYTRQMINQSNLTLYQCEEHRSSNLGQIKHPCDQVSSNKPVKDYPLMMVITFHTNNTLMDSLIGIILYNHITQTWFSWKTEAQQESIKKNTWIWSIINTGLRPSHSLLQSLKYKAQKISSP